MGRSSWNSFFNAEVVFFFPQHAHRKPFADLVGVVWRQGHHTPKSDSEARQQLVIKEGRVSLPPRTETHMLCNAFPAFNYLPVLPSLSTLLATVFFVLGQRNVTSLGFRSCSTLVISWHGFSSGGSSLGAEAYFPAHPPTCVSVP